MNFKMAYTTILALRGMSRQDAADATGRSLPAVHDMLRKGNPSVEVAADYLRACGYRLVCVPDGAKLPSGCAVIDPRPSRPASAAE